ncbi:spore germination protein [Alkalihalophilus pseudofirmus]|uniref:Spore germination protein n=1 Tax=Alkalihalophilus pseudofirmus TaxID=79885 RepID=A0AAJ2KTM9_ALKPS|nr:spore germination protein [Alkalihalophilus pseudofirmus]MDV2883643.1 spore germination protein [Alkalihalophilus pseudofirmus]
MYRKLLKKKRDTIQPLKTNAIDSSDLVDLTKLVKGYIGESSDIVQHDMVIAGLIKATLFYVSGLSDRDLLDNSVIKPIMQISQREVANISHEELIKKLSQEVINLSSVQSIKSLDQSVHLLMTGDSLLIVDGVDKVIILGTKGYEKRGIEEPKSEVVIRGPRDGFIEDIQTNIVLLRRRIADSNFIIQTGEIGQRAKIKYSIGYIKGLVTEELVNEVRYRISCIKTDEVLETGTLEQLIEDNVLSPFPQLMHTERPDKTTAALMNGKVIILIDGTPYSLITPTTFEQLLKSPEDYYDRWHIGTLIRLIRYLAAFFALFLPSLYIAMVTYHHGMIPTTLALSIAGTREGVPFPAFLEAFLMEITIELLREAGIRLPRAIGQTIGIVGGLVIGDAAVRAGFVSPVMVIVVAITAVASFAIPSYSFSIALRMLRFSFMIAASMFGLYGIVISYITINVHLVGLRSFGSYYTSPFAPFRYKDWLDLVFRAPLSQQRTRTNEPGTLDDIKQN